MVAIRYYSDTTTRRLLVAYETLATVLPRDACMRGIAIAVLAFLAVCQSVCYVRTLWANRLTFSGNNITTKFGRVRGLANRNLFPKYRELWSWGPVISCGDMHQSFTDRYNCSGFFYNFPMFADSFSVLSIHCVARGLGANSLYKYPASRGAGGSLRQHDLVEICLWTYGQIHRHMDTKTANTSYLSHGWG